MKLKTLSQKEFENFLKVLKIDSSGKLPYYEKLKSNVECDEIDLANYLHFLKISFELYQIFYRNKKKSFNEFMEEFHKNKT